MCRCVKAHETAPRGRKDNMPFPLPPASAKMGGRVARFLPARRAGALHAGSASIRRPTFLTHADMQACGRHRFSVRSRYRMNFHEYQAKELFAQYGIAVPPGKIANSADAAVDAANGAQKPWILDPVAVGDIRRWVQAMHYPNPLHFDETWAAESRFGALIASQIAVMLIVESAPARAPRLAVPVV